MSAMSPQFSFIVTTHLRAPLLRRSLGSILAQSEQDFEIIVVADALDAGTGLAVAELLRPQDQFIKRAGRPGPAESRNVGMRAARGEWVLFLDDDDSLEPHHLAALTQAIGSLGGAHPVLFSDLQVVYENRGQQGIEFIKSEAIPLGHVPVENLHVKNFIPNNTLAFRRYLLEGLSVDTHMASLEDWDFLLAVCTRAMPRHYAGGGAVVHKDINPGTRRGSSDAANNLTVVLDFIHAYRRWPAPSEALREQRRALIRSVGLDLPANWF
jgi:glycosyltransferase involved in cell wall biosynthesis